MLRGKIISLMMVVSVALVGGMLSTSELFAQKITISMLWEYSGQRNTVIDGYIKDYQEENPTISIKSIPFTGEPADYITKVLTSIAAGTPPDIFTTGDNTLYKYSAAGLLSPAPSDLAKLVEEGTVEELREAIVWEMTAGGKITYGVPWIADWVAMWINIDMFKEAGLPGAPASWEKLIDYAQKLTKYDVRPNLTRSGISLRLSGATSGIMDKFYSFLSAAGGDIYDENYTKTVFNSAAGVEAAQLYLDLLYKYKVDAIGNPNDAGAFAQGLTAMFERGPWVRGYLQENAPDLNYEVAPVPDHKVKAKNLAWIDAVVVTRASEYQQQAWDFVRYLLRPENRIKLLVAVGVPPLLENVTPLFPKEEYKKYIEPFLREETAKPAHLEKDYEIRTIAGKYLEKIFYRTIEVKEGLDLAAEEANKVLTRSR